MRRSLARSALLLGALALVAASCGGDDDDDGGAAPTEPAATGAPGTTGAAVFGRASE